MFRKRNIIIIVSVLVVVLLGVGIYYSGLGKFAYHKVRNEINEEVDEFNSEIKGSSGASKPEKNVNPDNYIGIDRAKEIALQKAELNSEQVIFQEVSLDKEDGIVVYDVEFNYGNVEYTVYIQAESGEIVKFEKDIDD